jgi:hypothetical protein
VHLVARELKAAGWKLPEITADNGSEFRATRFGHTVENTGARQRRIRPDARTRTRLRGVCS